MQTIAEDTFLERWSQRRKLSTKVVVFVLFVVPLVSNVFWGTLSGGTQSNTPNRVVVLVVALIIGASIHESILYYTKRLKFIDLLIATYGGLVLFEVGVDFSVGQVSGPFRMLLCLYGVAFLLRWGGSIPDTARIAVAGIGVALIWLFVTLPSTIGQGRLAYTGTANTSARDLLGMFGILYLIVINRRILSGTLRRIASLGIVAVLVLMLLTGSRQGIVLGIAVIWLGKRVFEGGVSLRVLFRRTFQVLGGIVLFTTGLYVMYVTTELAIIGRIFELSLGENMSRVVRYTVYYEYLIQNYSDLLIGGVDLSEIFHRGGEPIRIAGEKLGAPHNAFLEVGLTRGIIPMAFYIFIHVILILNMFHIHNKIGGHKTSSVALSIALSAFMIGMVTNYFTQVSTCLSYLFYSISGLYLNMSRDLGIK